MEARAMSRKAVIESVGMAVAERVMTNSEFEAIVETSDEWIRTRTGISERRVSSDGETCSYFAAKAAREALERASCDPGDVQMVVVATVTGDYIFPATASLVQDMIGAKNAGAFDVGAACAGFIYSAQVAASMIESGTIDNALVIGVDVLTKFVDWSDRSTCILFGDGGGAVLMRAQENTDRGLIATVMNSDGSGAKHIKIDVGGTLHPSGSESSKNKSCHIFMEGREVYRFAVKAMGESCCSVLNKAGISADEVDLFVPHQANLRIIEAASQRIGLRPEKVFVNVQKYGNMSAGSIPVALYEAEQSGKLKKGGLVLTVGFGAGLVWGANLIRW
jgi:3-oxoacyl-[acyl-carrier-protein] synthase-3